MTSSKKSSPKKHPFFALANVGPAMFGDLQLLDITTLHQLAQADPDEMYTRLQKITRVKQDPCVWDVFAAIVHEAKTGEKTVWWAWAPVRKKRQAAGTFCKP